MSMSENRSSTERIVHCWYGNEEDGDGGDFTCMLLAGHAGPHEFTPNSEIRVRFLSSDESSTGRSD